ncbi:cytochrome c biogenesis protein ResB [Nigerium massiliense]|uniref:cytochrome c biogenesis protein ResB n=1 Tax=Nigerium massiliense TaxID=1522317 RepID=UPI0009077FF6|nr:cytochrome c biogenesis protein ResB [Nigerium massiliense]
MAKNTTEDAAPLTPRESLRFLWTQLTSMRTALVLLFALAIAAVPGSLIPQRPVNPVKVSDFIRDNPTLGPIYDTLGLFDVYASPWFAAVYLLLFLSLIGCIVPRIATYARSLRAQPPRTPKRLSRLPESTTGLSALPAGETLDAAEAWLRKRRYRVRRQDDSVSAERGYLREFGNLLFHVSLVFVLAGVAWSTLFGYKGSVIVVEGQAFSNNLSQYDDFSAGGSFRPADLAPFTVWVDKFDAKFETGPVQRGAARVFTAHVRSQEGPGAAVVPGTLEVNHPLSLGDTAVHLIGHGYAPVVEVKDPQGHVAFSGPVAFLPQDGNFTSMGVIKAPDARPQRLAFECFFLPTAVVNQQGPHSIFPDALEPQMFCNAWSGPPRQETGRPENVYSLDKTGMTQLTRDGKIVNFRLSPGQAVDLPNGSTLTLLDWRRWTKLQVSSTPGLPLTFGSIVAAVAGLCLSLFVRPRRLFVRAVPGESGSAVEVGGLDRADARTGLDEEVAELAAAAGAAPPPAPGEQESDPAGARDPEPAQARSTRKGTP